MWSHCWTDLVFCSLLIKDQGQIQLSMELCFVFNLNSTLLKFPSTSIFQQCRCIMTQNVKQVAEELPELKQLAALNALFSHQSSFQSIKHFTFKTWEYFKMMAVKHLIDSFNYVVIAIFVIVLKCTFFWPHGLTLLLIIFYLIFVSQTHLQCFEIQWVCMWNIFFFPHWNTVVSSGDVTLNFVFVKKNLNDSVIAVF